MVTTSATTTSVTTDEADQHAYDDDGEYFLRSFGDHDYELFSSRAAHLDLENTFNNIGNFKLKMHLLFHNP
jgi:hypothetical protein